MTKLSENQLIDVAAILSAAIIQADATQGIIKDAKNGSAKHAVKLFGDIADELRRKHADRTATNVVKDARDAI